MKKGKRSSGHGRSVKHVVRPRLGKGALAFQLLHAVADAVSTLCKASRRTESKPDFPPSPIIQCPMPGTGRVLSVCGAAPSRGQRNQTRSRIIRTQALASCPGSPKQVCKSSALAKASQQIPKLSSTICKAGRLLPRPCLDREGQFWVSRPLDRLRFPKRSLDARFGASLITIMCENLFQSTRRH